MRPFIIWLALYGQSSSFKEPSIAVNDRDIISFDDISTESGLADIPSPYHDLSFSSYSVFKPHDPALEGLISDYDLNCAISSPNALLGSRPFENADGAYFEIANATAMHEQGLRPYFTLQSFYIKPMDAPAPGTTVYVKGFSKRSKDPLLWHVDFPSGYHLPFQVKMQEYSGEAWEEIHKVEIVADFGYDSLDWEFCIDDLKVQYITIPKTVTEKVSQDQVVLNKDYANGE